MSGCQWSIVAAEEMRLRAGEGKKVWVKSRDIRFMLQVERYVGTWVHLYCARVSHLAKIQALRPSGSSITI